MKFPKFLTFHAGCLLTTLICIIALPIFQVSQIAQAAEFAAPQFQQVWQRTDALVAAGRVSRSFLWGPQPNSAALWEDYAEAPGGRRLVQYFDKSRMEITYPAGDSGSPYYVTNGLLAKELISGQMQVGDTKFIARPPAQLGVAGDADDKLGPTYQALGHVLDPAPSAIGSTLATSLNRDGTTSSDVNDYFGRTYHLTNSYYAPETRHNIAGPFWSFLNQTGPVLNSGQEVAARLFDPVFYATGLPITEAYWTRIKVAGELKDVLVQAFERRVLTYTPANPPGFQVEMGNVGQHYFQWRYSGQVPQTVNPQGGKLVYARVVDNQTSQRAIFVADSAGNNAHEIARGEVSTPLFSPDGKRVAFVSRDRLPGDTTSQAPLNILSVGVDGSDQQVLYHSDVVAAVGLVRWSPRNRYLALWMTQNGPGQLYLLNLDGPPQLKAVEVPQGQATRLLDWTADGDKALWQAGVDYDDQNLYYGDPDKLNEAAVVLTRGEYRYSEDTPFKFYSAARFSPDGKTIAIAGSQLFFTSVPGETSPLDHTVADGLDGRPVGLAWSPDSRALGVLVLSSSSNVRSLVILDLATKGQVTLGANITSFDWSRQ